MYRMLSFKMSHLAKNVYKWQPIHRVWINVDVNVIYCD